MEMKQTSKELEVEHRLTKEVAARSQAQTELKTLRRSHAEDTIDLKAIEAEVLALSKNFEPDGAYWEILNGEMAELLDENAALRSQLEATRCADAGGLAAEMTDADVESL